MAILDFRTEQDCEVRKEGDFENPPPFRLRLLASQSCFAKSPAHTSCMGVRGVAAHPTSPESPGRPSLVARSPLRGSPSFSKGGGLILRLYERLQPLYVLPTPLEKWGTRRKAPKRAVMGDHPGTELGAGLRRLRGCSGVSNESGWAASSRSSQQAKSERCGF